jgi:hypothetical protein
MSWRKMVITGASASFETVSDLSGAAFDPTSAAGIVTLSNDRQVNRCDLDR